MVECIGSTRTEWGRKVGLVCEMGKLAEQIDAMKSHVNSAKFYELHLTLSFTTQSFTSRWWFRTRRARGCLSHCGCVSVPTRRAGCGRQATYSRRFLLKVQVIVSQRIYSQRNNLHKVVLGILRYTHLKSMYFELQELYNYMYVLLN